MFSSTRTKLPSDLTGTAFFDDCTPCEMRSIDRVATRVEVPAGRVLCVEGDIGAEFFVIVRGAFEVIRGGRLVAKLTEGQAFGEVALLCRTRTSRRTATVVAAEPSRVLVFNRAEFNGVVADVLPIARRLLERVSDIAVELAADRSTYSVLGNVDDDSVVTVAFARDNEGIAS
jgi:CRP-like cAMP-binding protein